MIGAIIGDIIGSRYEGDMNIAQPETLMQDYCDYTDDTVLTCAVSHALQAGSDFRQCIKEWVNRYPGRGYGGWFLSWVINDEGDTFGESRGNGAAMRVSAIAKLTEPGEAETLCDKITCLTHNSDEGLKGARCALSATLAALNTGSRDQVRVAVERQGWSVGMLTDYTQHQEFEDRCAHTLPRAIACAIEANSFEDVMRNCISIGGDVDTIGAIAGAIAEGLYGIPEEFINWAWEHLPEDMRTVLLGEYKVDRLEGIVDECTPTCQTFYEGIVEEDEASEHNTHPLSVLSEAFRRLIFKQRS